MRNRSAIRIILAAGCFLLCAAASFPQALAKAPRLILKRKKTQSTSRTVTPAAVKTQVVRQGDTLYGIAASTGTTVAALKAANQLRTTQLKVGQKLVLPVAPAKSARAAASKPAPRQALAKRLPEPRTAPAELASADSAPDETASAAPPGLSVPPKDGTDAGDDLAAQPLRYRLASMGLGFLGVRYRRSGESEQSGFDCSGLVKTVFDKFQISLPRSSREQFKVGEKVDKDSLEVGDLVFFSSRGRTPSHVGIYIGENQFLHAAIKAKRVLVSNLTSPWYMKRFLGARRFLDLWKDEPKADEPKSESK